MSLIILTVGTGVETRSNQSDVRSGLLATLSKINPRAIWLVPSSSCDSTSSADIIRENLPPELRLAFQHWDRDLGLAYRCINDPDDLEDCRKTVREVVRKARTILMEGERLIINPTSGTKQMSAGATLAALDEEIGDIQFTVGERRDGVVRSGTEQIASFDSSSYFEDRDLATAEELFKAGAFSSAAKILHGHKSARMKCARSKALCMHEWHRFNHNEAARQAKRFSESLARHLEILAAEPEISANLLRDLLASADDLRLWGDYDESLARYYRAAELAAKVILADSYGLLPCEGGIDGYAIEEVERLLPEGSPIAGELSRRGRRRVFLTLDLSWRLLAAADHASGLAYDQKPELSAVLDRRNLGLYGHGNRSATAEDLQLVRIGLTELFAAHYPVANWSGALRLRSLIADDDSH
jgi:hypothetical protein